MRLTSRKFIIAILLIVATIAICAMVLNAVPAASLVSVIPTLFGFAGIVLGAVAVMYPASNVFQTSKWSKDNVE